MQYLLERFKRPSHKLLAQDTRGFRNYKTLGRKITTYLVLHYGFVVWHKYYDTQKIHVVNPKNLWKMALFLRITLLYVINFLCFLICVSLNVCFLVVSSGLKIKDLMSTKLHKSVSQMALCIVIWSSEVFFI